MSDMQDNPCSGCMINCCKAMSGLVISKDEFERLFDMHKEGLVIRRSGRTFILSPKDGCVCPHFEGGRCKIYKNRPIDCRVYPYVTSWIFEKKNNVKIVFHTRADCPKKKLLYLSTPEAEARSLITAFAKSVFGEDKKIIVQYEKNRALQLLNRIESVQRRLFRIAGFGKA